MLGSPLGLKKRMARFLAPLARLAGKTVGTVLAKTPVTRTAIAKAREEQLKKMRQRKAVRRFLSLPRWYQDTIRPGFRSWTRRGRHTNRPTNPVVVARVMERAEAKRARRRGRNLLNEIRQETGQTMARRAMACHPSLRGPFVMTSAVRGAA